MNDQLEEWKSRFKKDIVANFREDAPFFDEAWDLFLTADPALNPREDDSRRSVPGRLYKLIQKVKRMRASADAGLVHVPSVDNRLRSEQTRVRLLPTVERIRKDLFGKTSAPFRSVEQASAWLEREIRKDETKFRKAGLEKVRARVQAIDREIRGLLDERRRTWPVTVTFTEDLNALDVWKPFKGNKGRGAFYPFRTYPGTRARKLYDEAKAIEGLTRGAEPAGLAFEGTTAWKVCDGNNDVRALARFTERQVLFWILADVKPLGISANLQIYSPITAREFQAMYREAARLGAAFKTRARLRKLTARNEQILRFIRKEGGPQATGIMEFWRTRTKDWNKEHPTDRFTCSGLKKAYERAVAKLEGLRQSPGWTWPGVAVLPGIDVQAVESAIADGKRPGHEIIVIYFPGAPKTWRSDYATFVADRLFLEAAIERFARSGGKPFYDRPRGASPD